MILLSFIWHCLQYVGLQLSFHSLLWVHCVLSWDGYIIQQVLHLLWITHHSFWMCCLTQSVDYQFFHLCLFLFHLCQLIEFVFDWTFPIILDNFFIILRFLWSTILSILLLLLNLGLNACFQIRGLWQQLQVLNSLILECWKFVLNPLINTLFCLWYHLKWLSFNRDHLLFLFLNQFQPDFELIYLSYYEFAAHFLS